MKGDGITGSVPKKQMRRRFLATSAAAGATTLGFPMIARAQTPITLRFQSTWPLKFIYHECAVDWCKKASDLTGAKSRCCPQEPSCQGCN